MKTDHRTDFLKLKAVIIAVGLLLITIALVPYTGDAQDIHHEVDDEENGADLASENVTGLRRPLWEEGDYWNYTQHLNTTDGPMEIMYQRGTVNYTVEGLTSIEVDGETYRAYNVTLRRDYRATGEKEVDVAGTIEFDLLGETWGQQYYRVDTLELLYSDFANEMEGIGEGSVSGYDFEVDVYILDRATMRRRDQGDHFSFPLESGMEWTSDSELEVHVNSYMNMTSDDDLPGFPRDEDDTYQYRVIKEQDLATGSEEEHESGDEIFSPLKIDRTTQWHWKDEDDRENGQSSMLFSEEAGNLLHRERENCFDPDTGMNITNSSSNLADFRYTHTPPEDYEFDVYAEDEESRAKPGKEATYSINLENRGTEEDTIEWRLTEETELESATGEEKIHLQPGESRTFEIALKFSSDAEVNRSYEHEIEFSSVGDPSAVSLVTVETWVTDNFLPRIISREPELRDMTVVGDKKVTLSVEVEDLEGDEIIVEWYVDGEYHSEGLEFEDQFESGEYTVTARVSDEYHHPDDHVSTIWELEVREREEPQYFLLYLLIGIIAAVVICAVAVYKKRGKIKELVVGD